MRILRSKYHYVVMRFIIYYITDAIFKARNMIAVNSRIHLYKKPKENYISIKRNVLSQSIIFFNKIGSNKNKYELCSTKYYTNCYL